MTRRGQAVEDWLRRVSCLNVNLDLRLRALLGVICEEVRKGWDEDMMAVSWNNQINDGQPCCSRYQQIIDGKLLEAPSCYAAQYTGTDVC